MPARLDANGRFVFENICLQEFELLVKFVGFKDYRSTYVSGQIDLDVEIMLEARKANIVQFGDEDDAFETFYGLLIGDSQRRLMLGNEVRMDGPLMIQHAEKAVLRWIFLFKPVS